MCCKHNYHLSRRMRCLYWHSLLLPRYMSTDRLEEPKYRVELYSRRDTFISKLFDPFVFQDEPWTVQPSRKLHFHVIRAIPIHYNCHEGFLLFKRQTRYIFCTVFIGGGGGGGEVQKTQVWMAFTVYRLHCLTQLLQPECAPPLRPMYASQECCVA